MENLRNKVKKTAPRLYCSTKKPVKQKKAELGGTEHAADAHSGRFWESLIKSAIPSSKVYIFRSDARFSGFMNHTQQDLKQAMRRFLEMSVCLLLWSFQHGYCLILWS